MKRLLCIVSTMDFGGAETFLMKIYRKIDRTKFQMDFCVQSPKKGYYEKEISELGGKLYRITQKSKNLKVFRKELEHLVKYGQYLYVMRVTSNAIGFLDLKIAKKAGAKICIARSSNSSDGKGFFKKVINWFGRFFYSNYVDVKIAPSDLAAIYTFGKSAYKNGKVSILHNGIDLDLYSFSEENRKKVRDELNIGNNLVIGHVGRFMAQKNHRFLIDVFFELKKKKDDCLLLLVGSGELKTEIIEYAKSLNMSGSIIFAGNRSDIYRVLSAFDILVFPSLYEGMPNVIIESQANGLPCIISDSITREVDLTGLVTFLSLNGSKEEWASSVLSLMNSRKKDIKKTLMEKHYDIQSVTEDFLRICKMK